MPVLLRFDRKADGGGLAAAAAAPRSLGLDERVRMGELVDELRSPEVGSSAAVTGRTALGAWSANFVFAKGDEWAGTVGREAAAPGGSVGEEDDLVNSIAEPQSRCDVTGNWRVCDGEGRCGVVVGVWDGDRSYRVEVGGLMAR